MKRIELEFADLEFTDKGAVSRFLDGSSFGALPHDAPHYHAIAHRLGYEGDTLRYAQEHELAHHVVMEHFGKRSDVLWMLANDKRVPRLLAATEEALAMALQRYARTNEHPLIDRVDWSALKRRFLELAESAR